MPIFFQHRIEGSASLGIWKIEEPEQFFLEKVPLKQQVSHPYKRLQHLAGRWLLPYLYPDFPLEEILIADTRKPFLTGENIIFPFHTVPIMRRPLPAAPAGWEWTSSS